MSHPLFTILAELQPTLAELGEILNPLKAPTGSFPPDRISDTDPFPLGRRRGPEKKNPAASRRGAPVAAPDESPACPVHIACALPRPKPWTRHPLFAKQEG